MKNLTTVFVILFLIALATSTISAAPLYVGADKCKMCHKSEKQGEQFPIWEASAHAGAYTTLATEEAKKIAAGMGIDDPQASDQCLSCHVTAFAAPAEQKAETYSLEEGVSCEACHGPGDEYKKMTVMKDREKAIAAGLIIPDEATCVTCHNDKSPTFKPFVFEERLKQIAHPIPAAE